MPLKVRKIVGKQVWLNKDSVELSNQSTPSDQHLVDRTLIELRPLSQTELDENFAYLEETKQPLDTDLTSIATLSTSPPDRSYGILSRRVEGDIRTRTIQGEVHPVTGITRIVINDGGGILGDPTITIGADIVTLNDPQTLTNKNIDGLQNTITHVDADLVDGYHAADLIALFPQFARIGQPYWSRNNDYIGESLRIIFGGQVIYVPANNNYCGCTCTCTCNCLGNCHSKCAKWG